MLKVAILGAAGRMGRTLTHLVAEHPGLELSGALVSSGSPLVGSDTDARVALTDQPSRALAGADVAIDFSVPAAAIPNADACVAAGCGLVIGTTDLSDEVRNALGRCAKEIPVLIAPNMSVGMNVLLSVVADAIRALGPDYDIEIIEAHHRSKVDAPSGTALRLGEVAAAARGDSLDHRATWQRHGKCGPREPGSIGFSVVRAGDIVGEHTLLLAADDERLELTHRATRRDAFAVGALRAARWLADRPPGLYSMSDVLGL